MLVFLLGMCVLIGLGGCTSPWRSQFEADYALAEETFPPRQSAEVRYVEPERLDAYFAARKERLAASDIAYEDWSEEMLREEDEAFLTALRLPVDPEEVIILGRSSFVAEERLDPRAGPLAEFAAEIGADYVVASVRYLGEEERISSYPSTSYSNVTVRRRVKTKKGYRYVTETGYGSSTTWVPMRITVDEFLHTAYFFRLVE
jgi:hypothetical protein